MRYFLFLLLFTGCISNKGKTIVQDNFQLDTIPQKANPKNLDLSKNQLFVDTTRTSSFYKEFLNWKPKNNFDVETNLIREPLLENLPESFIRIRKFKNDFIFYKACNGNIERIQIIKEYIIFYNDERIVSKIESFNESENKVSIKFKLKDEFVNLVIVFDKINGLYNVTLIKNNSIVYSYYMLPNIKEKLLKYNLMVNHCPNYRVPEFF